MRGNFITDRRGTKNPNYKHGLRRTRLFSIWANMLTRCHNPKFIRYYRYGGRGITVCDEWRNDFMSFYNWAMANGYDDSLTIDRINNDGNYEPSNCRWVTIKIQCNNRGNNHIVTLYGVSKPLNEMAELYGINPKTVRDRLKRGWKLEDALTKPVEIKFRRKLV